MKRKKMQFIFWGIFVFVVCVAAATKLLFDAWRD